MRSLSLLLSKQYIFIDEGSGSQTTDQTSPIVHASRNRCRRYSPFYSEGCEGYTYKFKFDSQLIDNDFVHANEDKRIVFAVGEEEMKLLKGTVLDHTSEMMREAFFVKENPNAEIACSCKTSFSPKDFLV